jgi:hypothetical protein
MAFDKQGFLSPEIGRFRASLREVPEYKSWLEYAAGLNQFALEILDGHEPLRADNQRLMISVLFIRAHKSFQSAIILAEDGLIGDARAIIRRATEGAVALYALANDASFVTQLMDAHYLWQRKTAKLILGNPDYVSVYAPGQIAQLQATVKQIDAMETTLIVFPEGNGGEWKPNRVARSIEGKHQFDGVWVVQLNGVKDGKYEYGVARLTMETGDAPTWVIKISSAFDDWTVEQIQ